MAKKRFKRGYISKVSTDEIPASNGLVDFLNWSGRTGSSSSVRADSRWLENRL